jgi:hypothetical protein
MRVGLLEAREGLIHGRRLLYGQILLQQLSEEFLLYTDCACVASCAFQGLVDESRPVALQLDAGRLTWKKRGGDRLTGERAA